MIRIPGLKRPGSPVLGLIGLNGALAAAVLAVAFQQFKEETAGFGPAAVAAATAQVSQSNFSAPQSPLFARNFIAHASQAPKSALPTAIATSASFLPEAQPLQWRVTGIIMVEGAAPTALIERKGQNAEAQRVSVGTSVDGWLVEHIAARAVSFRRGTQSVSMSLDPISEVNKAQSSEARN